MRRFALDYPEEVSGIVLVDPMRIEEWPPLDPGKQSEIDRGKKLFRIAIPAARVGLARLAVTSLFLRSGPRCAAVCRRRRQGRPARPRPHQRTRWARCRARSGPSLPPHWSRPGNYAGMRRHVEAVPDTVREMRNAEPIQKIPVRVLTPGNSTPLTDEQIGRIGNRVQQVIAPASAHWIHLDQPDLVIDSIREMVTAAAAQSMAAAD